MERPKHDEEEGRRIACHRCTGDAEECATRGICPSTGQNFVCKVVGGSPRRWLRSLFRATYSEGHCPEAGLEKFSAKRYQRPRGRCSRAGSD